jgi:MSHA pilin protein MshC
VLLEGAAMRQRVTGPSSGFTIIELVVVIVITGIIATVAVNRFTDNRAFSEHGFKEQLSGLLRYGQKLAIAARREVCVVLTPNGGGPGGAALSMNPTTVAGAACTAAAVLPGQGGNYSISTPTGLDLPAATFRFDPNGRPITNAGVALATFNITVTNAGLPLTVERETGYVH